MLSQREWMTVAERSAAATYGEKYAGAFAFRRFLLGPGGVLVALGALGLGAYWVWTSIADAISGVSESQSVPVAYWVAVAVLSLGTAVAFWPRRMPTLAHILIAKFAVAVLLWLGVIVFGAAAYLL